MQPTEGNDPVPVLIALLHDPEPRIRKLANFMLYELGAMAQPAIPDLQSTLDDADSDIASMARVALMHIESKNRSVSTVPKDEPELPGVMPSVADDK